MGIPQLLCYPPCETRADLAITLIEVVRFPDMAWKCFSNSQAEAPAFGIKDTFIRSCIAQAPCLSNQIVGNMDEADGNLDGVNYATFPSKMNQKMLSVVGQAVIQR